MFRGKDRGISAKIIMASLVSSMLAGLLVYFAAARNVLPGMPGTGPGDGSRAVPMQVTGGKSLLEGGPAQYPGENPGGGTVQVADQAAEIPVTQLVAKIATAGVVGITVESIHEESLFDRNSNREIGVGSGVIVSSDGYILTNNHVAGGKNNKLTVSIADGRNVTGRVVWADPVLDLAVVKVDLTGLTPLVLGDATKLEVGEPAIAIGNPFGLEFQRSVTSGIISALNRTIRIETETGPNYMEDLIQTDASINPGNSGGPLLNSRGEVIGINTVKVSSAEGIGFAIPINISKPIVEKLVGTGEFKEPYLGLFAYDKPVIPYIDGASDVPNGIYVAHVDRDGPAYRGGIRKGCIIRRIDGNEVNTMMQLRTYIYSKSPGDTVQITHLMHESNEWVTTAVVLGEKVKDGLLTR
ncbi:MAG: S1C family serine protease [Acetivibrionales bacterium]|jgi:serine protease Do